MAYGLMKRAFSFRGETKRGENGLPRRRSRKGTNSTSTSASIANSIRTRPDRGGGGSSSSLYTEAGLRHLIRDRLPTAESPPNYVRLWLGGYFTYRGVDPGRADRFLWSGAEFMDLALEELVEGFRAKLGSGRDRDASSAGRGGDKDGKRKGGGGGEDGGEKEKETETTAATGARYTRMVTETEVEMLALDVFNFIQSGKPSFWKRQLARAGRLVSRQATMGQRLDAFLSLVAYLGLLFLVLAGLSGIWTYNGFGKVVGRRRRDMGFGWDSA
ncbi:hypothetical protein PG997_001840 [Apiospora hydei]|uniref:Uncharacterized protein n=1 Tax=Apiospora hydei TaxID=1337664 RepID=A0ABR1X7M5_9PEZI